MKTTAASGEITTTRALNLPERRKLSRTGDTAPSLFVSKPQRLRVLARDHGACRVCGRTKGPLHIERMKLHSRAVIERDEDLVTICLACGTKRENKRFGDAQATL